MMKTAHTRTILFLLLVLLMAAACSRDKSMVMNNPHNIRGVVSYKRAFDDQNAVHLVMAQAKGIPSVPSREAAEKMKKRLYELTDTTLYRVDELTHSIPFLVSHANELLSRIGRNFRDSLQCKGLNCYKPVVTSVLRTEEDVAKLRRTNVNASPNSAHCHGTTFDISYKRFVMVERSDGRPQEPVGADTLKMVLAEVLRDLRSADACCVKYELKQGCFHITAR